MKRSMLTVCAAVLASSALLVLGATGCANEGDAGDDVVTLGQTQQDLSLGEKGEGTAQPQSAGQVAASEDEGPSGGRPQPEPWAAPATTGVGPGPAPDSDPRRVNASTAVQAGSDRPQPEPWNGGSATNVSLTKNQ